MKIGVVGSINMDMTVTAPRIPCKGETLIGGSVQYIPGGKGANQAVAMARLGAEVEMFGCVGTDAFGTQLIRNLEVNGVKTGNIKQIENQSTGMAFITVGDQDNTIIVVPGANQCVTMQYVEEMTVQLQECGIIVLQHEIPLETVAYIIEFCSQNNIQVVLNPAPAFAVAEELVQKVTYLTPNEHEAALIFGADKSAEEMLNKYPEKLIITQGSRGVATALKNGEILRVPARPAQVADTTGAGDTLNGAFTVRISKGDKIGDALFYGNIAASLSTEKFGAQAGMPGYQEVEEEMERMKK